MNCIKAGETLVVEREQNAWLGVGPRNVTVSPVRQAGYARSTATILILCYPTATSRTHYSDHRMRGQHHITLHWSTEFSFGRAHCLLALPDSANQSASSDSSPFVHRPRRLEVMMQ